MRIGGRWWCLLLTLAGCIENARPSDADDASRHVGADAAEAQDAGRADDMAVEPDRGVRDAAVEPDRGVRDATVGPDRGVRDAAVEPDLGGADGGEPGPCAHPRSTCRPGGCGAGECRPVPVEGAPCVCVTDPPDDRAGEVRDEDLNQCRDNADCLERGGLPGTCTGYGRDVTDTYCGGARPPQANECHYANCRTQADCLAGRACVPPGAYRFIAALCVTAECLLDADCAARPGGECRPFLTACNVRGFACTYADDPCRADADCPPDHLCQPGEGRTRCEELMPAP